VRSEAINGRTAAGRMRSQEFCARAAVNNLPSLAIVGFLPERHWWTHSFHSQRLFDHSDSKKPRACDPGRSR